MKIQIGTLGILKEKPGLSEWAFVKMAYPEENPDCLLVQTLNSLDHCVGVNFFQPVIEQTGCENLLEALRQGHGKKALELAKL